MPLLAVQIRVFDSIVAEDTELAHFPGYLSVVIADSMATMKKVARTLWAGKPGWLAPDHRADLFIQLDPYSGGQSKTRDHNNCAVLACLRMATLAILQARLANCRTKAARDAEWVTYKQLSHHVLVHMPEARITSARPIRELFFDSAVLGSFLLCSEGILGHDHADEGAMEFE